MKRLSAISRSRAADANDSYSCGIITLVCWLVWVFFLNLFSFLTNVFTNILRKDTSVYSAA